MSVGNQTQAITFDNKNLVLVLGENMDLGEMMLVQEMVLVKQLLLMHYLMYSLVEHLPILKETILLIKLITKIW